MNKPFVEVALNVPLNQSFTYKVPKNLSEQIKVGKRVLVPFGRRKLTGFVISFSDKTEFANTKDVIEVIDDEPLLDSKKLKFFKWLSDYYFTPLGEVLSLSVPSTLNLKSLKVFAITDDGLMSIKAGLVTDETLLEILIYLKKEKALNLIEKKFGKDSGKNLRKLLKKNYIEESLKITGGEKFKTVKYAAALTETVPESLSKKPLQQRLLSGLVNDGGEVLVSTLRKEFGGVDSALKSLAKQGLVEIIEKEKDFIIDESFLKVDKVKESTPEQLKVIKEIANDIGGGAYSPYLLFGVTGSGKTHVYLELIKEALKKNKTVLYLVPEIGLIPRAQAFLENLFPGQYALIHSKQNPSERVREWLKIKEGKAQIVLGPRSALFSPLKDIGLIIVDEEHEPSYKQADTNLRYNGRDSALMLSSLLGATVVLGSATPSFETLYNAELGKVKRLDLKDRVKGATLPDMEIVSLKKSQGILSDRLKALTAEELEKGHQVIYFLNRRGFSHLLLCRDCGHIFECLNCSVSLTYHKNKNILKCHHCDLEQKVPTECPKCYSEELHDPGFGTERVEELLREDFPKKRIGRMDRDTTTRKGSVQKIIDAMDSTDIDILVGTQMVSKGHHFESVTLSAILSADSILGLPDFRALERTYQLIMQASGRAGRGEKKGRVLIQTFSPDNDCFKYLLSHDYEGFYKSEILHRRELDYPPFGRLALIALSSLKEEVLDKALYSLSHINKNLLNKEKYKSAVTVLGPTKALHYRLKNRYRYMMTVKAIDENGDSSNTAKTLNSFVYELKQSLENQNIKGLDLKIDIDPYTIL